MLLLLKTLGLLLLEVNLKVSDEGLPVAFGLVDSQHVELQLRGPHRCLESFQQYIVFLPKISRGELGMLGRAMSTFVMFLSAATLQAMPIETTLNLLEAFSTSVSILVNTFSLSRLSAPFLSCQGP